MKLVRSLFLALAVMFSASLVQAADAPAAGGAAPAGDTAGKEKKAKKGKAAGAEGEKKAEEKPAK